MTRAVSGTANARPVATVPITLPNNEQHLFDSQERHGSPVAGASFVLGDSSKSLDCTSIFPVARATTMPAGLASSLSTATDQRADRHSREFGS